LNRIDSNFMSHGTRCAGWLYMPDNCSSPPVVIMAHGFGAERSFRLPAFAKRFCELGLAVFLFDYRNFGDSDGEPRNLISPKRHLEDWLSAINYVRSLKMVDGTRLALFGTSFSGGHILVTAANTPGISAIVAQVPFVDGIASASLYPVRFQVRAFAHAMLDLLSIIFRTKPHYIPIVAEPNQFGLMNTAECMPGVLSILPPDYQWKNYAPARIALTLPLYRPVNYASRIKCPALIIAAERDSLIPLWAVEKTAAKIPDAKIIKLPCGHFDVYTGELFEKVVSLEADFLAQHLLKN